MKHSLLLAPILVGALASTAHAVNGPDLVTTITPPPLTAVYATGHYQVTVLNTGNQNAASASLAIQLPATHTSPQVYVMGNLIAQSASCARTGTVLNCNLGQIKRNKSVTVFFDIQLPESAAPLTFTAVASTAGEADPPDNTATHDATLSYPDVTAGPSGLAVNQHCTGTGLTAWFECTKFPSSITSHNVDMLPGGTIDFLGQGGGTYTGTWAVSGGTPLQRSVLTFSYYDSGNLVASFTGRGVDGNCFEGLTIFVPPPYVAPYRVCF